MMLCPSQLICAESQRKCVGGLSASQGACAGNGPESRVGAPIIVRLHLPRPAAFLLRNFPAATDPAGLDDISAAFAANARLLPARRNGNALYQAQLGQLWREWARLYFGKPLICLSMATGILGAAR